MKRATVVVVAMLQIAPAGCAGLLAALAPIAQGAQALGSILDVAEAGSDAYLDRHPNREAELQVGAALRRSRLALAALNAAAAAAKSADDEDLGAARKNATEAYARLRELLYDLGIPQALPPLGGAESSDAPEPEPFVLPAAAEVEKLMGDE